ncbi:hypothetical protein SAMN05880501_11318 [Ureibacillus xyleni]|uniref:Uncharacterized protein n=1 Tax=Ureibacillus xyleni TaxID=614648 RepID=A0A285THN8_9BACL|nr:hypothetical protein [Ureibacillus xyleni]SOC21562.1 hypothetical protein SAMN05880501_11318 [Ureibacillus xyleni]
MTVKAVYSIRINRKDEDLRNYLDRIDVKKQNIVIKKLLHIGLAKVQADYENGDEVYSVRLTEEDSEIIEYLAHFEQQYRNAHLKRLLKIGFAVDQVQHQFTKIQQSNDSKLDEMMELIKQLSPQIAEVKDSNSPSHAQSDVFDPETFAQSLKEGLSLFEMGDDNW